MGLWCPKSTVLHILLNISKSSPLNFKNNPIFGIYVKFAVDWWYSFTYLVKNSLRKRLAKIEEMKKEAAASVFWNPPTTGQCIPRTRQRRSNKRNRKEQKTIKKTNELLLRQANTWHQKTIMFSCRFVRVINGIRKQ